MNILGNSFRWGLGGYENGPFGHKGSNWKTENAWDLTTQSDTDVYSITDGTVTKIKTLKTGDGHLFGTSIEILGRGEYPTIFYCNLSFVSIKLRKIRKDLVSLRSPIHFPFVVSVSLVLIFCFLVV